MALEVDPHASGYAQALVRHDPRLRLWAAASTYTEADTIVGPATPAETSGLRIAPAGEPTTTDSIRVEVERGGYPGSGLSLAWSSEDVYPDTWFGWDPPTSVSYVEPAFWSTSGVVGDIHYQPDAVTLPDDRVVVVSAENDGGATAVRILVRAADGTWSTSDQLDETIHTYASTSVYPWASVWYEPPPADLPSAPGYVRVAWLTYDEDAQVYQVAISECSDADDPSDPADWRLVERAALPAAVQAAAGAFKRVRARWSGGQVVLCIQTSTGAITQYASADGLRYRAVSGTVDALEGAWDVARIGPLLTLAYCTDSGDSVLTTASVGDAFAAFSNAVQVDVFGAGSVFADQGAKVLICEADPGQGWLYLTRDDDADEHSYAFQTLDGGQSWIGLTSTTAGGSTVQGTGWLGGWGFEHAAAVWWRDRVFVVAQTHDTGGYDGSLLCVHLGGYVDVSHPWRSDGGQQIHRWSYARTWIPTDDPANVVTETQGGAPVLAWTADASRKVTTDPGEFVRWDWTSSGSYTSIARQVRAALKVTSGSADLFARWSDGTESYGAYIHVTSTTVQLFDLSSLSSVGSAADVSGDVEVRLMVYRNAVQSYYRTWEAGVPGQWVQIHIASGALADSGAVDPWEGLVTNASSVTDTYCLSLSIALPTASLRSGGVVRSSEWIATYGVDTVQYPARPQGSFSAWYDRSISLRAQGGPGRVGQRWTVTPTATYPVSLAAVSSTYPSPRDGWLPPDSGAQVVAYRLYDDVAEDCDTICDLWFLWIQTDAPSVSVEWNEAGVWQTPVVKALYAPITATRTGNTLALDEIATSAAGATYIERDELVGSYVWEAGGKARRIVSHTAGVMLADNDDERQTPIFTLDGIDGTEPSTSTTWYVHIGVTVIPIVAPTKARGIRITESAPTGIPPSGRRRSKHLVGPAMILGDPHQLVTATVTTLAVVDVEQEDTRTIRRVPGQPRRSVELTWSTTQHPRTQIQADLADPAFVRPWTSTGRPAYSVGGTAGEVAAVVRSWAGAPVLYVPSYIHGSQSTEILVGHRARGAMLAHVDPSWTVEATSGVEYRSDIVRPGGLRLVEVV